jgi:hypothetical protein
MPPIIGTAMRCISSDAFPSFRRIGSKPATPPRQSSFLAGPVRRRLA